MTRTWKWPVRPSSNVKVHSVLPPVSTETFTKLHLDTRQLVIPISSLQHPLIYNPKRSMRIRWAGHISFVKKRETHKTRLIFMGKHWINRPLERCEYSHTSLNEGIRSEKCVVRWLNRCANVIECKYTNLDSIASYTRRLYGIAYCS
jgi:hypothetical protein